MLATSDGKDDTVQKTKNKEQGLCKGCSQESAQTAKGDTPWHHPVNSSTNPARGTVGTCRGTASGPSRIPCPSQPGVENITCRRESGCECYVGDEQCPADRRNNEKLLCKLGTYLTLQAESCLTLIPSICDKRKHTDCSGQLKSLPHRG